MAKKKSKKKSTKQKKNKQIKKGTNNFFTTYWQEKSPVFRFMAGFAACIIVFYALYYST